MFVIETYHKFQKYPRVLLRTYEVKTIKITRTSNITKYHTFKIYNTKIKQGNKEKTERTGQQ